MNIKHAIALIFLVLNTAMLCERPEKHIVIVTASYNNAEWYKWNLDRVFDQKYENWRMIYVDDYSLDGTGELVKAYVRERGFEHKVTVICNKNRRGAMANQYFAIKHFCKPTDIVVILDGDDRFTCDVVLREVNYMYSTQDVWLTYGQFVEYPSGKRGFCRPMPEDVIEKNGFRDHNLIPSHLRTFYAGLFHKIEFKDLLYQGDFFPRACDLAIMFPMIEMARDHFMCSGAIMLEYNMSNPINDYKVALDVLLRCDKEIRSRRRYDKIESPF